MLSLAHTQHCPRLTWTHLVASALLHTILHLYHASYPLALSSWTHTLLARGLPTNCSCETCLVMLMQAMLTLVLPPVLYSGVCCAYILALPGRTLRVRAQPLWELIEEENAARRQAGGNPPGPLALAVLQAFGDPGPVAPPAPRQA